MSGGEKGSKGKSNKNSEKRKKENLIWQGEEYNSMKIPSNPSSKIATELSKYGISGIQYVDGDVDFSPVSKFDLPFEDEKELYNSIGQFPIEKIMDVSENEARKKFNGTVRSEWQKIAKEQIVNKIKSDPSFAKDFQSKTGVSVYEIENITDLSNEIKRVGLTMHESPDCKKIQLVPTYIHNTFRHSGGTSSMLEKLLSGDLHSIYRDENYKMSEDRMTALQRVLNLQ